MLFYASDSAPPIVASETGSDLIEPMRIPRSLLIPLEQVRRLQQVSQNGTTGDVRKTNAYVPLILGLRCPRAPPYKAILDLKPTSRILAVCFSSSKIRDNDEDVDKDDDHHKEKQGGLFIPVDMSRSIADKLSCLDSISPLHRSTRNPDIFKAMSANEGMEEAF